MAAAETSGEVHDENAARLGGVAGHAGLFSTARDLARFARLYLNGGTIDGTRVFDSATVAVFTRVQDSSVSRRALGWETPTGRNSAGTKLSPLAFGHTGFTGTSIWMDPAQDLFVVLLTNRVNPTRQNTGIGAVRSRIADAVSAAMSGTSAGSSGARLRERPRGNITARCCKALPTPPHCRGISRRNRGFLQGEYSSRYFSYSTH